MDRPGDAELVLASAMAEKVSDASTVRQAASGLRCLGVRRAAADASLGRGVTASTASASADGACPIGWRNPPRTAAGDGRAAVWAAAHLASNRTRLPAIELMVTVDGRPFTVTCTVSGALNATGTSIGPMGVPSL